MTPADIEIDEATLHAYVDGQLPPERAAQVADWLLSHPRAAQQVLGWREQRESLKALHRDWLDEPVPPSLTTALRPPAANSLPMLVSVMSPKITMITLGGIMMPSVPPAAIEPRASESA